ncbi:MAG: hypothetical protein II062_04810, partial [Oscillospiraceae bacterium]|nr:hypothetical protein [Oscillospiraceae bacterium]
GAMKTLIMLGAILVVGAIGMRIIMGATPRAKFWHHVKHGGPAPEPEQPSAPAAENSKPAEKEPADEANEAKEVSHEED